MSNDVTSLKLHGMASSWSDCWHNVPYRVRARALHKAASAGGNGRAAGAVDRLQDGDHDESELRGMGQCVSGPDDNGALGPGHPVESQNPKKPFLRP